MRLAAGSAAADEACRIQYLEDCAMITVRVRLEYCSERPEGGGVHPSPPRSPAFARVAEAMAEYASHTLCPGTSPVGTVPKPRRYEVARGAR